METAVKLAEPDLSIFDEGTRRQIKKFGPKGTFQNFTNLARIAERNNHPLAADYRKEAKKIAQIFGLL